MPKIEKPDFKARKQMPAAFKLFILIAIVFGLWAHSCLKKNEVEKITFDNIVLENQTPFSIDVIFDLTNNTLQSGKKPVLIEVFTDQNELIGSKLVNVDVNPKATNRHVKVLDKLNRRLREGEDITTAKVSLYQRSIF